MGDSTCVSCGECVAACPTGALVDKALETARRPPAVLKLRRLGVPLLRRRLRAPLSRRRRPQPGGLRRGTDRLGQRRSPVREGPLRVRLRDPPPAPHAAARPRRLPQARPVTRGGELDAKPRPPGPPGGLRPGAAGVPRGELGRGPRPRRPAAARDPRARRRRRPRRLRLGEVQQRRGLPVPEARPRRVRHEQRGPLHAALPRVVGDRAAADDRIRRRHHHLRRHRQQRLRAHHRQQHHGEPPGGRHLLQAGRRPGHAPAGGRPHPDAHRRLRLALLPDPPGHRRRLLQRDDARDHRGGARRPGLRGPRHERLRGGGAQRRALHAPGGGGHLRRPRGGAARGGDRLRARARRHHVLGHGDEPARARHGQLPLHHLPVPDDGERGPPGDRAASPARAEQRPGRVRRRAHPHELSRLPARDVARGAPPLRAGLGPPPGSGARTHHRRDHGGRPRRARAGHVHPGREPLPERSEHEPRARRARAARVPGRAGHLPDRDRRVRRRDPAGHLGAREDGNLHQHRPPRAARAPGARAARRGAPRLADPLRRRHAHGLPDALRRRLADLRRAGLPFARVSGALPRGPGPDGQALPVSGSGHVGGDGGDVRRRLPDRRRPRPLRAGLPSGGRRAARRRVPADPHHRPAARALAHRAR